MSDQQPQLALNPPEGLDLNVPEEKLTEQHLGFWYRCSQELDRIKAFEFYLRPRLFKRFFAVDPEEGVNNFQLNDGYVLKGTRKINRKVVEAELDAMRKPQEGKNQTIFEENGIDINTVIRWKPELNIGVYRKLTAEQQRIVDMVLEIKDGMPDLDVVMPKRKA